VLHGTNPQERCHSLTLFTSTHGRDTGLRSWLRKFDSFWRC